MYRRDLKERALEFGAAILRIYPRIAALGPPYQHMALQLFRAASSIGAHLQAGDVAASKRDMGLKHAIALREAKESTHWLRLLITDGRMTEELRPHLAEAHAFVAMLTTSVKKLRGPESDCCELTAPSLASAFCLLP